MREHPRSFGSYPQIHWLCAAVDRLLGESDLANVPALMAGFGSILDHPRAASFAPAGHTLRHLGVDAASDIMLRQVVHDAVTWEDEHRDDEGFLEPPYEINIENPRYPFRLREGFAHVVDDMVRFLTAGLPFRQQGRVYADPSRPIMVVPRDADEGERITLDLSEIGELPDPPRHDFGRRPRGPIDIPIAELEAIAREMDVRDGEDPQRPRGNWLSRLREMNGDRKFHILVPDRRRGKLRDVDTIRLDGLKHLIGLPGTGKTTLIVLLLMWLDRKDYRTVVLLPSIEASLNLLGDLRFYQADVGLLVGQSPQTRINHARKLAERIGTDESRGFGRSAPGADLMSLNCALGAFDTDDSRDIEFPHLMPPCTSLRQRNLKRDGTLGQQEGDRLCPVAGWCGRLKAPRELTGHRIWLGHVLSTDTRISPHFSEFEIRYYEAIAMTADLVIVDEADGAQANLDGKAIASLDLTGSTGSYESQLLADVMWPFSRGRNYNISSSVHQYSNAASEFIRLNKSLVILLQRIHKDNPGSHPLERFKDTFVTGNNVISELFCAENVNDLTDEERVNEERRFNAIRMFWDACASSALFNRTEDEEEDNEAYPINREEVAQTLGYERDAIEEAARRVTDLLRDWLNDLVPRRQETILITLRDYVFSLITPREGLGPEERNTLFAFLVSVTTVIMRFQMLVRAQQAMTAEGIHHEPPFSDGISRELSQTVPEALIGRLSGVRYHLNQGEGGRPTLIVQYVSFRGTPRLLLYRLHELLRHDPLNRERGGPNVLLASATSFLEESPTYHIPAGPDLVLRRTTTDDGWRDSEYRFAPIVDRDNPSFYLRYSGAPLAKRERILRRMIDHYFRGAAPLAVAMTQDFDPGRKVAFVVNSYDQVRIFKDQVRRLSMGLSQRLIGVTDHPPAGNQGDWITAAQVERLGARPNDWDFLVFPMKALSRGVNIVFESGDRRRDALLGTVIFLTRPHPAIESLDLVAGLAGSQSLRFDQRALPDDMSISRISDEWRAARRELLATTRRLLRYPLQASRLGDLAEPFTGDIMVDVLQTIGRAMRNGCKARVIFADAAWAPNSLDPESGKRESSTSSMIVLMRDILRNRVDDPDPVDREIYQALYEPFLRPLENCQGVSFPDGGQTR